MTEAPETVRLDRWLWAARLVKTRSMAVEAIAGGRVHVNGQRVKPSRAPARRPTKRDRRRLEATRRGRR